jgi:uncharacterized protein (TIGR03000 family)
MFRRILSYGALPLCVSLAFMITPGTSLAQHGGGGHFGGGHVGTSHFGGGGFHHGSPHSYHPYGYHHQYYRGFYPYYGLYGYYPYYGGTDSYDWSDPAYDSGYSGYSSSSDPYPYHDPTLQPDLRDSGPYQFGRGYTYGNTAPVAASTPEYTYGNTAPVVASTRALLTVKVPQDTQLWFDGSKTTTVGSMREFRSPPLTPGKRYTYEIRARWNDNGHEITQVQQVQFTAGDHIDVTFPTPTKAR